MASARLETARARLRADRIGLVELNEVTVFGRVAGGTGGRVDHADALALLNEPTKPVHAYNPLVQIDSSKGQLTETRV